MSLIWGVNYSIVKHAFRELHPQAFNALRMTIASFVFLVVIAALQWRRSRPGPEVAPPPERSIGSIFHTPARISRSDWLGLAALGLVGQFLYQYLFVAGLARTSVANSSLIIAATPVLVALVTAARGEDRIGTLHWLGVGLSLAGIYIVVGRGASVGGSSWRGDLIMAAAVCCWAAYTLGARPLMTRHSPVGVTGLSMAIGTALYLPVALPHLRQAEWRGVSAGTWLALVYSALFALCIAYTIWYAAVREIGSARTSIYSNLIPVVAMLSAVMFLGEPLGGQKLVGAAAVLLGVGLTRVRRRVPHTARAAD